MKRYKKYKDSGIEWIGEIPEEWDTERVKFLANYVKTGSTPPSDSKEYYEKGTIDWYSPSDFQQLILKDAKRKITQKAIIDKKCRMYAKGSILLVGIGATVGKIGITNRDCTSNQQINAINFNEKVNPNFIVYYFSSIKSIIVNKADSATLPIFNQTQTKELFVPIPSTLQEQTQIANYLDHKTKQIDELIDDKQNLIELLKEERTATINQAVTSGLDKKGNLRQKPQYLPAEGWRDSGIEWLGEIPVGWEVTRLANLGKFLKGRGVARADLTETGVPVVLYGDIYTKYNLVTTQLERKTSIETAKGSIKIEKGDLLYTASGETKEDIGKCICFFGEEQSYAGGDVVIFRQNNNNSLFLSYVFNSFGILIQKAKLSKGEIVVHIYASQLRNIHFGLPLMEEQIQIVNYLKTKDIEFGHKINKTEHQITLLKEYKTALISEVVTGKVDVRDEVLN